VVQLLLVVPPADLREVPGLPEVAAPAAPPPPPPPPVAVVAEVLPLLLLS